MKKAYWALTFIFFMGCTTATIPSYLPDNQPYTMRFYADYERTLETISQSLKDLGWKIEKTTNPIIYEQNLIETVNQQQALIITEVRQTPMVVGTRYARLNVFLRSQENVSDVEIRYLTITSLPLKSIRSYENKGAVERIFGHIKESLAQSR